MKQQYTVTNKGGSEIKVQMGQNRRY